MDNSDLIDASGTAIDSTGTPLPGASSLADATSAATGGTSNNFFSSFLNTLQPAAQVATSVLGAVNGGSKATSPAKTTPVSAGTAAAAAGNWMKYLPWAIGGGVALLVAFKLIKK